MTDLTSLIFQILRQMDAEAEPTTEGVPTGLNWYGGHARTELKKPQSEPEWSKAIAERLREQGFNAEAEVRYPASDAVETPRTRCDVVVMDENGRRTWIEIKGAWRTYWEQSGSLLLYRSYLLHPLVDGLDPKTHTVPLDMQKLATLRKPDADEAGILLIGFDSTQSPMDDDVAELTSLAGLDDAPWSLAADEWDDAQRPGERIRCWLWRRPV